MVRKNVKNLNLRVYPAERKVRVSVPRRIAQKEVVRFISGKYPWIQKKLSQYRHAPTKQSVRFSSGEIHSIWGKNFTLNVLEKNKPPKVLFPNEQTILLQVRPGSSTKKRESVLKEWYRTELKREIPMLIEKWEPPMGVSVREFGVKQMKTRWGTCNIRDRRIWLNLELAKKRPELLEYVVVHEMVHLLERLHNKRFYSLMEKFLPNWQKLEIALNGKMRIRNC